MIGGYTLGYSILLWLVTGWLLLQFDSKLMKSANMAKETKVARFTGWFNLVTGLALTLWNWIM